MWSSSYIDSFHRFTVVNFRDHFITIIGLPFLLLGVIGALARRNLISFVLFCFFIVILVALYTFHPRDGWPQYGARYWYTAWVPLAILVGYGIETIKPRMPRVALLALVGGLPVARPLWFG